MDEKGRKQIELLKKKNAVILAHYYVDGEVQEIADYVGDSYFLAKKQQKYRQSLMKCIGRS